MLPALPSKDEAYVVSPGTYHRVKSRLVLSNHGAGRTVGVAVSKRVGEYDSCLVGNQRQSDGCVPFIDCIDQVNSSCNRAKRVRLTAAPIRSGVYSPG